MYVSNFFIYVCTDRNFMARVRPVYFFMLHGPANVTQTNQQLKSEVTCKNESMVSQPYFLLKPQSAANCSDYRIIERSHFSTIIFPLIIIAKFFNCIFLEVAAKQPIVEHLVEFRNKSMSISIIIFYSVYCS